MSEKNTFYSWEQVVWSVVFFLFILDKRASKKNVLLKSFSTNTITEYFLELFVSICNQKNASNSVYCEHDKRKARLLNISLRIQTIKTHNNLDHLYVLNVASPQTSFAGEKWMLDERTPKDVCGEATLKVARTYLFGRWLCFWIAFFGRNDLTYFYDFWHL